VFVLLPSLLAISCSEAPPTPPDDAGIARLIGQLGSEKFSEREAAGEALLAIGEPALKALRQAAATSEDAEIRRRATTLVAVIRKRFLAARAPKLRTVIGKAHAARVVHQHRHHVLPIR